MGSPTNASFVVRWIANEKVNGNSSSTNIPVLGQKVFEPSMISRGLNRLIRLVIAISLCLGSPIAANATLYVIVCPERERNYDCGR
jgi:hypothetical protein